MLQTQLYALNKRSFSSTLLGEGSRANMRRKMDQLNKVEADGDPVIYQLYDATSGKLLSSTGNGGGCGAEQRYRKSLTDRLPNNPKCRAWPWETKTGRWGPRK